MRYTANIRRAKDKDDIFPTPEWVTEALMSHVKFDGLVFEPACGYGHMAKKLSKNGMSVVLQTRTIWVMDK